MATKLKQHLELPNCGLILLEAEPQMRTIYCHKYVRVPLPYLYFAVRYTKYQDKFFYLGIAGRGLLVFCRNAPMTEIVDAICYTPINQGGWVCTDHAYDNGVFNNPYILAEKVMGYWYSMDHVGYWDTHFDPPLGVWQTLTVEQALRFPWKKTNYTYFDYMKIYANNYKCFTTCQDFSVLKDEPFPLKKV